MGGSNLTKLIYLTPSTPSGPAPRCHRGDECRCAYGRGWSAKWGDNRADGSTIGEAVDRIVRHAPGGRLDRLVMVIRGDHPPGPPLPAWSAADEKPIRYRLGDYAPCKPN